MTPRRSSSTAPTRRGRLARQERSCATPRSGSSRRCTSSAERHIGEAVVAVTHAVMIRLVCARLSNASGELWRIPVGRGSYSRFLRAGRRHHARPTRRRETTSTDRSHGFGLPAASVRLPPRASAHPVTRAGCWRSCRPPGSRSSRRRSRTSHTGSAQQRRSPDRARRRRACGGYPPCTGSSPSWHRPPSTREHNLPPTATSLSCMNRYSSCKSSRAISPRPSPPSYDSEKPSTVALAAPYAIGRTTCGDRPIRSHKVTFA